MEAVKRIGVPGVSADRVLNSIITIQSHIRGFSSRSLAYRIRIKKDTTDYNAAVTIQKHFRGYVGRAAFEQECMTEAFMAERTRAATELQTLFRILMETYNCTKMLLAIVEAQAEQLSALFIQSVWKTVKPRRVLKEERKHVVLKWMYDLMTNKLEIIGTFRNETMEIHQMHWCTVRKCHCYVVPLQKITRRVHFRYRVDGQDALDGSFPIEPYNGIECNCIIVLKKTQ
eukprot:Platyproteum_vivax@DN1211_c0_g1_i1.p1